MLISAANSSLLIVDIQDRLLPAMVAQEQVLTNTKILLKAAEVLTVPVTISEQYPKGLGKTVAALASHDAHVMEKTSFSCWRDPAMKEHFIRYHDQGRPLVIVAGLEAHVCVLQSCIDLATMGFVVFAVVDAMSSRRSESVSLALTRMRSSGIQTVNTEMVIFELLEKAGTAAFKSLSALIK
jgi:nicotinamidase-related amidase